ncbi:MAG: serine hydrolase [Candidatus Brocadiia bacterium]
MTKYTFVALALLTIFLASCAPKSGDGAKSPAIEVKTIPVAGADQQQQDTAAIQKLADDFRTAYNGKDAPAVFALFGPEMQTALPLSSTTAMLVSLHMQFGTIKEMKFQGMLERGTALYLVDFDNAKLNMNMTLGKDGKMSGLWLAPALVPPDLTAYDPVIAESADLEAAVTDLAELYLASPSYVGLEIGVYWKGVEYEWGFGQVSMYDDKPPTPDTLFEVGSISKVFTCLLVERAVREGKLKLTEDISRFLPAITLADPRVAKITILDLVTHTSGLPTTPTNLAATVKNPQDPFANYTEDDLYEFLGSFVLPRDPGTEYEYSNTGMTMAGLFASYALGGEYGKLLQEMVLVPMGLADTTLAPAKEQQKRMAQGFSLGKQPIPSWNLGIYNPAGGVKSTVRDLLSFARYNMGDKKGDLYADMKECHRPRYRISDKLEIALGWHIFDDQSGSEPIVWHNGRTGAFCAFLGFLPSSDAAVVILCNTPATVDQGGGKLLKALGGK